MSEQTEKRITCPKCGSEHWRCWDERTHYFRDRDTGDVYEFPVGYLACNDCGYDWMHDDTPASDEDVTDEFHDYYD